MNKDKISAQDIIDSLALTDDVTKRVAEDFFKAFIASIEDALLQNESVKIKDLGTFKLQKVAPRRSVNVQTGEDILLDGYYKVNFTTDNQLKDLVNQPFAHLESVVLDGKKKVKEEKPLAVSETINPLSTLEEQASEIKDLLSEINSMNQPVKEVKISTSQKKKKKDDDVVGEPLDIPIDITYKKDITEEQEVVVPEIPKQEEILPPPIPASAKKPEVKIEEKAVKKPIEINPELAAKDNSLIDSINAELEKSKSKTKTWPWVLLVLILLAIGASLALFYYNSTVNEWVHKHILKYNVEVVEPIEDAINENSDILDEYMLSEETKLTDDAGEKILEDHVINIENESFIEKNDVTVVAKDDWDTVFESRLQDVQYIKTVKIQAGTHLATLAQEYYGSPYYWVYIYEVNKDSIPNPNNVAIGTSIKLPKLDSRLIDPENPKCKEKALDLRKEYLKK